SPPVTSSGASMLLLARLHQTLITYSHFYTASIFKAVHAFESGVKPSPSSPNQLRCIGPWEWIPAIYLLSSPFLCVLRPWRMLWVITSRIKSHQKVVHNFPPLISPKTASLWPSHHHGSWIGNPTNSLSFLCVSLCFRM
ncbi:hypothetical protein IGI04_031203, partial [Brassica rapa subsp. trilocularis]